MADIDYYSYAIQVDRSPLLIFFWGGRYGSLPECALCVVACGWGWRLIEQEREEKKRIEEIR